MTFMGYNELPYMIMLVVTHIHIAINSINFAILKHQYVTCDLKVCENLVGHER